MSDSTKLTPISASTITAFSGGDEDALEGDILEPQGDLNTPTLSPLERFAIIDFFEKLGLAIDHFSVNRVQHSLFRSVADIAPAFTVESTECFARATYQVIRQTQQNNVIVFRTVGGEEEHILEQSLNEEGFVTEETYQAITENVALHIGVDPTALWAEVKNGEVIDLTAAEASLVISDGTEPS